MESEGPYTIDSKGEIWWILFDGEKVQTVPKDLVCYSTLVCSLLNTAHAEGRKAAEKNGLEELCFPLLRKIDIQEKEFKELLALAKDMREFITDECLDSRKVVAGDFDAWKKARWIE